MTITHQLEQLRQRIHASPLGSFFRWWGGELRELLPEKWRARLLPPRRVVLLRLSEEDLQVMVQEADAQLELGVFPLNEDPRLHQQKLRELLVDRELLESPRELQIGEQGILRKEVVLPLAAESGLAQALSYEMDRQTPFRSDDVYFDYRVLRRDRDGGKLRVELLVAPRVGLDHDLELLGMRGLVPSGVDVLVDDVPVGVNLLPVAMRHRFVNWRTRFNWALTGLMILLLAGVMWQSLWLRQLQIRAVEDSIEEVRSEAMRVQQVREQIEDARAAASFMTERRAKALPTVKVLAEVTRLLPDDTYLDRLVVGEGTVQMQGKSSNAQRLIELVNQSSYFDNAAFRGPTRLDTRSQREIFDLTANSSPGGEG